MRRLYWLIAAIFVVAVVFTAFFLTRKPSSPNVLLITIDTLRSDHCSSYGYPRKTTPHLDQIGLEGVRFENAYAPMATTASSHATMFTSLYPISHGVVKNGYVLNSEFTTLAEFFQQAGYQTAGIVSSFVLHSKFGLNQGFTHYDDQFSREHSSVGWKRWQNFPIEEGFDRRAEETANRTIQWLETANKKPFFLWIHFFDPHSPYEPVKRFRSRFSSPNADKLQNEIDAYDEEILSVDYEIGRIMNFLNEEGLSKNTMVVLTADHGEGLMQHGRMGHGHNIYEEAVKVPLVFRFPQKIPSNKVISEPVELVDLAVTILQLAGISVKESKFQGFDLANVISGTSTPVNREVFLQRRAYENQKGDKYGILKDHFKYIESRGEGVYELYDLRDDPNELQNIHQAHPDLSLKLAQSLENWIKAHASGDGSQKEISEEDAERLKALGYVQ